MGMRRLLVAVVLLPLLISLAGAAGLVRNPEFVDRAAGKDSWPADWAAAPAVTPLYAAVNDDGCTDKDCLHYGPGRPGPRPGHPEPRP